MSYKKLYQEGEYQITHPTWHVEDASWKTEAISKIIEKNNLSIKSISDVGCGAGGILRNLQKSLPEGIQYSGYDISPQAISLCKKWENENLSFWNEDLLDLETEFFDLILCIDVFEHIGDYLGFLQKLRSKGHYKVFHIPLDLSVQTLLRPSAIARRRTISGHLHYFTKETALTALRDTGYEIIDFGYTSSNRSWVGTHRYSLSVYTNMKSAVISAIRNLLFALNSDFAVRLLGGYSLIVLST